MYCHTLKVFMKLNVVLRICYVQYSDASVRNWQSTHVNYLKIFFTMPFAPKVDKENIIKYFQNNINNRRSGAFTNKWLISWYCSLLSKNRQKHSNFIRVLTTDDCLNCIRISSKDTKSTNFEENLSIQYKRKLRLSVKYFHGVYWNRHNKAWAWHDHF